MKALASSLALGVVRVVRVVRVLRVLRVLALGAARTVGGGRRRDAEQLDAQVRADLQADLPAVAHQVHAHPYLRSRQRVQCQQCLERERHITRYWQVIH